MHGPSIPAPTLAHSRRLTTALIVCSILLSFALFAAFLQRAHRVSLAFIVIVFAAVAALPTARRGAAAAIDALQSRPLLAAASGFAGAALMPFFLLGDSYWIHVLTITMIFSIMAIGLNVHLGEIGLVNLGYAGLFAIGAYSSTLLSHAGVPFLFSTLFAMGVCWIVGGFIGFCSIRTSGDYFALVTLGFGLIVQQLIINLTWLTRGTDGITGIPPVMIFGHSSKSPIDLGFMRLAPEANLYYVCLVALAVSVAVVAKYRSVWVGRMWTALRQDSIGVSCFGLNVPRFKVLTVAFGSMFAGLGGSLFAHQIGFISPDDFSLLHSIEVLASVILGGIGNLTGAIVGTAILHIAPEKLRFLGDYRLLMYGVMLVVILIYRPRGLMPDPRRRFDNS